MRIEARFSSKPPESTENIQRLTLRHMGLEIEIVPTDNGIRIRLDQPLGAQLAVFPHASNTIALVAAREDDIKPVRS